VRLKEVAQLRNAGLSPFQFLVGAIKSRSFFQKN